MSILLVFLKSYWKHLLVAGAIAGVSFMTFNYIYDMGFKASDVACEKRMQEYNKALNDRITSLELVSKTASLEDKERDDARKRDLEKLLQQTKNKPLTIIKEGNCIPSEVFIDTLNAAIDRVNQK